MAEETRIQATSGAEKPQGDGWERRSGGGEGRRSVGWGGWGFSTFSVLSDLQKAASVAAQEISRNAAAVAKGITDIKISEEDAKSDASADKEGNELENDLHDEKNLLRKSALDKLERASEESLLGQGLKVLDNSVEGLASGAWLALGNALKGGSNLVHKYDIMEDFMVASFGMPFYNFQSCFLHTEVHDHNLLASKAYHINYR